MKSERFTATIVSGHKEHAVEVPFDPASRWSVKPTSIRAGRRGFAVSVRTPSAHFESFIVARSRKHWLLLAESALRALGAQPGAKVTLTLSPAEGSSEG